MCKPSSLQWSWHTDLCRVTIHSESKTTADHLTLSSLQEASLMMPRILAWFTVMEDPNRLQAEDLTQNFKIIQSIYIICFALIVQNKFFQQFDAAFPLFLF